jgi:type IV secretion system protein VirB6
MNKIKFLILILLTFRSLSVFAVSADEVQSSLQTEFNAGVGAVASGVDEVLNTMTSVVTSIANLTCESREVLKVIRGQMDHTCTPTPLASIIASQYLAPNSMATLMRLSINNTELLGYNNCAVYNRANYYNPKIEFGLCLNKKLMPAAAAALGEGVLATVSATLQGQDPFAAFNKAVKLTPEQIYGKPPIELNISGDNNSGETKFFWDIPVNVVGTTDIPLMPLQLKRVDDKVCVSANNWYVSAPIGCKYTHDPYPLSKYAGFMGEDVGKLKNGALKGQLDSQSYQELLTSSYKKLQCSNIMKGTNSCYYDAVNNSKTLLPISAPIINCIKQMVDGFLNNETTCNADGGKSPSALMTFQKNMHRSVTALMMIYIILNGIKIFFGGMADQKEIIMFFLKVVLVSYFSIGINLSSDGQTHSGMAEIIFPFLLSGINDVAGWIMSAASNGLCVFKPEEYTGGENYALWDALDCRVTTYIGISGFADLYSSLRDTGAIDTTKDGLEMINYSIPPYFLLLIPAIYTGNIYLAMLAISFPILVISIAAYIVQSFIVCLIFIAILGVLAPLFVPMALFEYTYSYFENWMKLLVSFVLQPAVSITFSILVFSIYDWGFSGTCKYIAINITMSSSDSSENAPTLKSFFIDVENADKDCKKTLGWWLADKFDFKGVTTISLVDLNKAKAGLGGGIGYFGDIAIDGAVAVVAKTGEVAYETAKGLGNFLLTGNFLTVPTAPLKGFFQLVSSMLVACFAIYIGYQVSGQLSNFAADMTGGISVGAIVSSPKQNFDLAMSAISAAAGAMKGGSGGAKGPSETGQSSNQSGAQDGSSVQRPGSVQSSSATDYIGKSINNSVGQTVNHSVDAHKKPTNTGTEDKIQKNDEPNKEKDGVSENKEKTKDKVSHETRQVPK